MFSQTQAHTDASTIPLITCFKIHVKKKRIVNEKEREGVGEIEREIYIDRPTHKMRRV